LLKVVLLKKNHPIISRTNMPPQFSQASYHLVQEDEEVPFLQKDLTKPLRVCCYGSSSPKTPDKYMNEAYNLGLLLAKRGHTCVNGAGAHGCMSAMNNGAVAGDGHIVGVMHEMFVVDGADWLGVCGTHDAFRTSNSQGGSGPTREILIAGGDDLQERKKLLVDKADALVVLPGGPGTFDEVRNYCLTANKKYVMMSLTTSSCAILP
jgi:predicted Rossmann-fold nucleotide-binding protein